MRDAGAQSPPAWDAPVGDTSPLDEGLFECQRDRAICCLGVCCPCVLVQRTATFVGDDGWM